MVYDGSAIAMSSSFVVVYFGVLWASHVFQSHSHSQFAGVDCNEFEVGTWSTTQIQTADLTDLHNSHLFLGPCILSVDGLD